MNNFISYDEMSIHLNSKPCYKKMNIKSVFTLEKLKEKNPQKYTKQMNKIKVHKILTYKISEKLIKYINRDMKATKNMITIVSSYIEKNVKPKIFVLGTKIHNDTLI